MRFRLIIFQASTCTYIYKILRRFQSVKLPLKPMAPANSKLAS